MIDRLSLENLLAKWETEARDARALADAHRHQGEPTAATYARQAAGLEGCARELRAAMEKTRSDLELVTAILTTRGIPHRVAAEQHEIILAGVCTMTFNPHDDTLNQIWSVQRK